MDVTAISSMAIMWLCLDTNSGTAGDYKAQFYASREIYPHGFHNFS